MDLQENPFYVLGASTRDTKHRLLELAEERALSGDPEIVSRARLALSHPRKRLSAELGWFPGLTAGQASQTVSLLLEDPWKAFALSWLPALGKANLQAAALTRIQPTVEEWPGLVLKLAAAFESIDRPNALHIINVDRVLAGIQEVDREWLDETLAERRAHFKTVVKSALDRLPSRDLVTVITRILESVAPADTGKAQTFALVDDLVDVYEVEAHKFLNAEAANVEAISSTIRKALDASQPKERIERLLDRLEAVVQNWYLVAQPIQLSSRSRGRDHNISHRVGFEVRSLAVDIYNDHNLLECSKRLTELMRRVFAKVPRVAEVANSDAKVLKQVEDKHAESEGARRKWTESIRYRGVVRGLFNEPLEISEHGIDWKGQRWPLECITRVRWGGRLGASGVFTANIAFGTDSHVAVIAMDDRWFFEDVADRLWWAVGLRLMVDLLKRVRAGETVSFGQIRIRDLGAELPYYGPNVYEQIFVPWAELTFETSNGEMFLADRNRGGTLKASLSFLCDDNAVILHHALKRFWKNSESKLSSILDD